MNVISLRSRILLAFALCTALVALLFGLSAIIFAYHTEDRVFETLLQSEAAYAEQQLARGAAVSPRLSFVRYYAALSELPPQISTTLQQTPTQTEFALRGDQHFHLLALSTGFLLADVTEQLVVRQMRPQLSAFLLILLMIMMLSSAGFAYLLAGRLLKPLNKLTNIVDSAGQGDAVLAVSRRFAGDFAADEIGRLALALQTSWQRIADFVHREQQFTQDVSHELRTPLAVIQGALTLLQHSPLSGQQSLLVERLHSAQLQINQTIETLLLLAREQLSATKPVPLLPLIEQSILQQHDKLAGKRVELELEIASDAQVNFDKNALLLLLNNLIGNAFQYTASGIVRIAFEQQRLIVQDTGPGIDTALQAHIFEPGVKGKDSQGLGVGLSLVKRLCDKNSISCQINSSGEGTCVRLLFPQ